MRDATSTAADIRSGRLTAREAVEESLSRIETADPLLNAFTVTFPDEAMAAARAADENLGRGEVVGRLHGVPVSIKDHIWLAGKPATNGSLALRDFVPVTDCVAVARLKRAGAVVVGKTNNPEFCYRGFTDNLLYGLTRNPWNLERTPGGSSGGAAAAVAAGMTPIALGTDGGGSIRIPASFCGVFGHKPTFGLVPKEPGFRGWKTLSVDGPLTSSVRDAALALTLMAGATPADDMTWPVDVGDVLRAVRDEDVLGRLRIAVSEDLGWAPVEPDVLGAFSAALDRLANAGAQLTRAHPVSPHPSRLWNSVALPEGYASEGALLDSHAEVLAPGTVEIIEAGRDITAAAYLDAMHQRADYSRIWAEFFQGFDVLLTPMMQLTAFSVSVTGPAFIDGRPIDPFFDDWCTLALPANLTGGPAASVPVGFGADGLPVGMQVLGGRFADATVLAVAAAYERLAPWADAVPPFAGHPG